VCRKDIRIAERPFPLTAPASGTWLLTLKPSQYPVGTYARALVEQFNVAYTKLLHALQETFDGAPQSLDAAIGLMYELNMQCGQVVETVDPVTGKQAAPWFELV
jgi:hypothetical protein